MLKITEGEIEIQRNCQHSVWKTKENKAKTQHNMCYTPLYTQISMNYVNKTWALHKTGGKDELNIVFRTKITIGKCICSYK